MLVKKTKKIFIGVAWPYVNGDIHVGHLAGYLLPSDILARFFRQRGNPVLMVSGSDCFGTPILFEAIKRKTEPKRLEMWYHKKVVSLFKFLNLSFDIYTKTDNPLHKKVVQDLFLTLLKKGYIFPKTLKQYWSEKEGMFLPDRFVEGQCSFCEKEGARGDQCDFCGRILEPGELINPRSRLSGKEVTLKETEHYFMDWPRLSNFLEKYVSQKEHFWKKWVVNETKGWLKTGLIPRPVTRDISWGVKIPGEKIPPQKRIKQWQKKRIYVWFDAVIGYLSASIEYSQKKKMPELWKEFWLTKNALHYYFMGKDNLLFHTLFWPGQLHSYNPRLHLPDVVSVNHYLTFEHQKFSKSRGVMLECDRVVRDYGLDEVRFYILSIMPEYKDASFSWDDFYQKVNNVLVATLGNFFHRTLVLAKKNKIQASQKYLQKEVIRKVEKTFDCFDASVVRCRFRDYLECLLDLARYGNVYLDKRSPWREEKREKLEKTLTNLLYLVGALSVFSAPALPLSAEKLQKMLNFSQPKEISSFQKLHRYLLENLQNLKISRPVPLFKKINPAKIKKEKQKLNDQPDNN